MAVIGQARRGSNDISFTLSDGSRLQCHLFRERTHRIRVRRRAAPVEEGQQPRYREAAKVWRDWRRGAGYEVADEETDGGYGYGSFLDAENRGLLGPAGYVEELPLPSGVVTRFNRSFELAGSLWYTCLNQRMLKVPSLTDTPVDAGVSMTGGASQDAVVFGAKAWIANAGNARMWSFDGTNWQPATDDVRRSRLAVTNWVLGSTMAGGGMSAGAPYRILVSSDPGTNGIYHCSGDPGVAANHVGPNAVGDSAYPLQRLISTSEAVFACKPDGIYMVQGGGRMPCLSPWWRDEYDASNGATAEFYDGWVVAGTVNNLQLISADTSRLGQQIQCQPGAGESFESSPIFGRATASTQFDGKVVVAFSNGARSYVMFGRLAQRLGIRNRNPVIWYGSYFECDGTIRDIRLVSPTNAALPRYIYYATDDSSGVPRLFRQEYPRAPSAYAAYKRGEAWRAAAAWSAVMSSEDFGDPDAPKISRFYGCVAENLGDGNSVTISTNTDVAAADTTQATLQTSPRDYAVAETTTAKGHRVTVTASVANEPARPVFIRAIKMRGTVNDEKTTVVTVPIELGRGVRGNHGQVELRDSRVQAVLLYGLLEEGPVAWTDWMGRTATVVVEDIEEEEVDDPDGNGVTRIATLTVSTLLTDARYGTALYGAGRYA